MATNLALRFPKQTYQKIRGKPRWHALGMGVAEDFTPPKPDLNTPRRGVSTSAHLQTNPRWFLSLSKSHIAANTV